MSLIVNQAIEDIHSVVKPDLNNREVGLMSKNIKSSPLKGSGNKLTTYVKNKSSNRGRGSNTYTGELEHNHKHLFRNPVTWIIQSPTPSLWKKDDAVFIENCPKEGSNAILLSNMKVEENQSVRASPKAEPSNIKYLKNRRL